ncbi:hypothetical protein [Wolbachia endosymbiont of Psylliodes chrysocephala]|uniref:hypothetical protein n=1 Tax=Wolbachia endosymbiont of Psylliodes chrysocephala TaxID=2883236 RepID=UPI00209CE910|nr:hypothetical protein [Wolbachia endosymbiont of Psylliodes chrysocephala]
MYFYVPFCNIGNKGAEALANGNLSHLTSLNLQSNNIGNKGAEALAKGNFLNLTLLNLDDNSSIGYRGTEALANGSLLNLTSLYLSSSSSIFSGSKAPMVLAKLEKRREAEKTRLKEMEENQNRLREIEEMRAQIQANDQPYKPNEVQTILDIQLSSSNSYQQQGQASNTQFDQQQKPNAQATSTQQQAQATNDSNMPPMSMLRRDTLKRKSSSEPEVSTASSNKLSRLFKKFKSNKASQQQGAQTQFDQPGPSSKLDEVPLISRSQSLSSLYSNGVA